MNTVLFACVNLMNFKWQKRLRVLQRLWKNRWGYQEGACYRCKRCFESDQSEHWAKILIIEEEIEEKTVFFLDLLNVIVC